MEVTMKQVPVFILFAANQKQDFEVKFVQVRNSATYGDLKKRIADCVGVLTKTATKIDQVRLWMVSQDVDLNASMQAALAANQDQEMKEENVEFNSGVECPGNHSLEPYIGSSMVLEDKNFISDAILVEVAGPDFLFKYTK